MDGGARRKDLCVDYLPCVIAAKRSEQVYVGGTLRELVEGYPTPATADHAGMIEVDDLTAPRQARDRCDRHMLDMPDDRDSQPPIGRRWLANPRHRDSFVETVFMAELKHERGCHARITRACVRVASVVGAAPPESAVLAAALVVGVHGSALREAVSVVAAPPLALRHRDTTSGTPRRGSASSP